MDKAAALNIRQKAHEALIVEAQKRHRQVSEQVKLLISQGMEIKAEIDLMQEACEVLAEEENTPLKKVG